MPPRKKSKPASPAYNPPDDYRLDNDAPWGGFINIRLDDEQKTAFFIWLEQNSAHYPALFDDMLGQGVKITIAYDLEHSAYILTSTGALVGSDPKKRFASTSRAGSLNEAIALTVWKHFELTQGDYGNYRPKDSAFMSWG